MQTSFPPPFFCQTTQQQQKPCHCGGAPVACGLQITIFGYKSNMLSNCLCRRKPSVRWRGRISSLPVQELSGVLIRGELGRITGERLPSVRRQTCDNGGKRQRQTASSASGGSRQKMFRSSLRHLLSFCYSCSRCVELGVHEGERSKVVLVKSLKRWSLAILLGTAC